MFCRVCTDVQRLMHKCDIKSIIYNLYRTFDFVLYGFSCLTELLTYLHDLCSSYALTVSAPINRSALISVEEIKLMYSTIVSYSTNR